MMKDLNILALLMIVLAILLFTPIFTIWSMNHLFNVGWVIDVPTWFSVFWLTAVFAGGLKAAGKSK